MLTTKQILTNTANEFNLPYDTVESLYKAWVRGFKDRLIQEEILYFYLTKGLPIYFTTRVNVAERGTNRPLPKISASRERKRREIKKIIKRLEKVNTPHRANTQVIYQHYPPLDFYGYRKGYRLKELEQIQQKMFDKFNKYEYPKNPKI